MKVYITFTEQELDHLKDIFDVPIRPNDSADMIRWKAAQREVYQELVRMDEVSRKDPDMTHPAYL